MSSAPGLRNRNAERFCFFTKLSVLLSVTNIVGRAVYKPYQAGFRVPAIGIEYTNRVYRTGDIGVNISIHEQNSDRFLQHMG